MKKSLSISLSALCLVIGASQAHASVFINQPVFMASSTFIATNGAAVPQNYFTTALSSGTIASTSFEVNSVSGSPTYMLTAVTDLTTGQIACAGDTSSFVQFTGLGFYTMNCTTNPSLNHPVNAGDSLEYSFAFSSNTAGFVFDRSGFVGSDISGDPFYYASDASSPFNAPFIQSHFISTIPISGATTGTTTTIGAEVYISPSDFVPGMTLNINLVNNTLQNGVGGSALDAWNATFGDLSFPLSSGDNVISTTSTFSINGQVNATYNVTHPSTVLFIGQFLPPAVLISTSTQFVVVQPTGLDLAMASTSEVLISALITGTSSQSIINCNPANFDITTCLISLIIPPTSVYTNALNTLYGSVLTHFPLGYITDFVSIMATTTQGSLTVLDVTVPPGIPGTGAHLTLSLDHQLDPVLDATTGPFTNISASSTDTFYQYTSVYWDYAVDLGVLLYIINRITGLMRARHHNLT